MPFAELPVATLRDGVSLADARSHFDEDGDPRDTPGLSAAVNTVLGQPMWWAAALQQACERSPFAA
ncbi:hypothetical protein [Streptomyces sp. NPDC060027]|uniref:hypothetical protein n=1 Tax=Streptomyces sp. NPDC060027 TaxID=3347040 RepID=UPI0036BE16E1